MLLFEVLLVISRPRQSQGLLYKHCCHYFINLLTLCESRLFAAVASDWSELQLPTMNRLCCTRSGYSKPQMKLKSHFWYISYSIFCGVVISFLLLGLHCNIGKGLCCSLRSRLVCSIASNSFDHHTDRSRER